MNKYLSKTLIVLMVVLALFTASCKKDDKEPKKFTVSFYSDETLVHEEKVNENDKANEYKTEKENYKFLGWYLDNTLYDFTLPVTKDLKLIAKWEQNQNLKFTISGNQQIELNGTVKLTIHYEEGSEKGKITWTIDNPEVADFDKTTDTYARVTGIKPGKATITATCKTKENLTASVKFNIEVLGETYTISYDLDEEEKYLLPSDAINSYNTASMPITLPTLSKEHYVFLGWEIKGFEGIFKEIKFEDGIDGNISLKPKWIFPRINLYLLNNRVTIGVGEEIKTIAEVMDVEEEDINFGLKYEIANTSIASISKTGNVVGLKEGYTEIKVSLKSNPSINASVGITVTKNINEMNELLKYFAEVATNVNTVKDIRVVGWQKEYMHELRTSVIGYLFEDLPITENLAPVGNPNRPGTKYPKHYICVHDTGDVVYTAKDWNRTVYYAKYVDESSPNNGQFYEPSYQYVVDNRDVYHNIPDDETAYHAGDGTRNPYIEIPTGVYGTEKYPKMTLTKDGYFALDGKKTTVKAPTDDKGNILTTEDINDDGIRCVLKEGQYYLGKTWYSARQIVNFGGNLNSIGIETCMTEGDDIYYTWQRVAKLVAKLMDENNLEIDDVVSHHYFSGKNCPQTKRTAEMWGHFKSLIQIEYDVLQYLQKGYTVSFKSNDPEYVNNLGRVIKASSLSHVVSYDITVTKGGVSETLTLSKTIMHKPF